MMIFVLIFYFFSALCKSNDNFDSQSYDLWEEVLEHTSKNTGFSEQIKKFLTIQCQHFSTTTERCLCEESDQVKRLLKKIPKTLPLETYFACENAILHECSVIKPNPKTTPDYLLNTLCSILKSASTSHESTLKAAEAFEQFQNALSHVQVPYKPWHHTTETPSFPLLFEDLSMTPNPPREVIWVTLREHFGAVENEHDLLLLNKCFQNKTVSLFLQKNSWDTLTQPQSLPQLILLDQEHIEAKPKTPIGVGKGAWQDVLQSLFPKEHSLCDEVHKLIHTMQSYIQPSLSSVQQDLALIFLTTLIYETTSRHGHTFFLSTSMPDLLSSIYYHLKISGSLPNKLKIDKFKYSVEHLPLILNLPEGEYFFIDKEDFKKPATAFWSAGNANILRHPGASNHCWKHLVRDIHRLTKNNRPYPLSIKDISELGGQGLQPYYLFYFEGTQYLQTIYSYESDHDSFLIQCIKESNKRRTLLEPSSRDACWRAIINAHKEKIARKNATHLLRLQLTTHALSEDTKKTDLCEKALKTLAST